MIAPEDDRRDALFQEIVEEGETGRMRPELRDPVGPIAKKTWNGGSKYAKAIGVGIPGTH